MIGQARKFLGKSTWKKETGQRFVVSKIFSSSFFLSVFWLLGIDYCCLHQGSALQANYSAVRSEKNGFYIYFFKLLTGDIESLKRRG